MERPPIYLYTDGASSGNPGPGGYGVVLKCAGNEKEIFEGFSLTTNNRMELLAVIKGLEAIKWDNAEVHVYSDSSYVVNAINKGWLEGWQRKGFAKVKNPDLWMRFLAVYKRHRVACRCGSLIGWLSIGLRAMQDIQKMRGVTGLLSLLERVLWRQGRCSLLIPDIILQKILLYKI